MQVRERKQARVDHLVGREDAARVDVLPIEQIQVDRPKDVARIRAAFQRVAGPQPASSVCSGSADCG